MDWFFDNLGKFIPIVIGLFYFIASLKKGGEEEAEKSPEAQERARKIQEEIRRKILERQGGGSVPVERSPIEPRESRPRIELWEEEEYNPMIPETERPRSAPVIVPEYTEPSQTAQYEAQRLEVERKLEDVRVFKQKLASKKLEQSKRAKFAREQSQPQTKQRVSLRGSLRGTRSLRKAIVLKEVLGEPIAFRGN